MATKTDIKNMPVVDLRTFLQIHFDGIEDDETKGNLKDIVDENWAFLSGIVEGMSIEELLEGEVYDPDAEPEPELEPEVKSFLAMDLYSGYKTPIE